TPFADGRRKGGGLPLTQRCRRAATEVLTDRDILLAFGDTPAAVARETAIRAFHRAGAISIWGHVAGARHGAVELAGPGQRVGRRPGTAAAQGGDPRTGHWSLRRVHPAAGRD